MPRILVIDDHASIRILLRVVLEEAGYEVLEAANGRLGLELYHERSADLIITDLAMPEMNGLELLVYLTRTSPHVNVIAMSGTPESEGLFTTAKQLGAQHTFPKPLDMELLLSAVRTNLAIKEICPVLEPVKTPMISR